MVTPIKKSDFTTGNCFVVFSSLCAVSLLYSPFLLSISMWGFCVVALWESYLKVNSEFTFWPRLKKAFQTMFSILWKSPAYRAFTILFFIVFLSGLWSNDIDFWLERLRIRIPFFVLPWAFANAPKLSNKQWKIPLQILIAVMFLTCVGVGMNYFFHQKEILLKIQQGQSIPVPRNHIRFSLTLAFCCFLALHFSLNTERKNWKTIYAGLSIFFFCFAHFLAVRSGLLALYLSASFLLLRFIFVEKKVLFGSLILLALPALLWTARTYVPSFSNKINYMQWELNEFRNGRGVGNSDSGRWSSIHVGIELTKDAPLFGVGIGDLDNESKIKTEELYPHLGSAYKLPHNEYIYILASTGIMGFLLSLYAFLAFFKEKTYRNSILCIIFAIIAHSSFLTEYTIETAIGVAFYLFFTLYMILQPQK